MSNFTENLWGDIVREHGSALAQADRVEPSRGARLRRPRVLAGGTLGMAGIATALVLALGGSTAAPAFAVTQADDGSVLVTLNSVPGETVPGLNAKLAQMGVNESVGLYFASGAATAGGPVTCSLGATAKTPIKILVGSDGTQTLGPGEGEAEGTFHLDHCVAQTAGETAGDETE
jgi:hypothetical protein